MEIYILLFSFSLFLSILFVIVSFIIQVQTEHLIVNKHALDLQSFKVNSGLAISGSFILYSFPLMILTLKFLGFYMTACDYNLILLFFMFLSLILFSIGISETNNYKDSTVDSIVDPEIQNKITTFICMACFSFIFIFFCMIMFLRDNNFIFKYFI
jgi:hypothetical protein